MRKINETANVMSVALRKFSFNVKSYYDPMGCPLGSMEPWKFCEAPLELWRMGREKGMG